MRTFAITLLSASVQAVELGWYRGSWATHDVPWEWLHPLDRQAWMAFGYDLGCWDHGACGTAVEDYGKMSYDELYRLDRLGYTPMTWNRDGVSSERSVTQEMIPDWISCRIAVFEKDGYKTDLQMLFEVFRGVRLGHSCFETEKMYVITFS